MGRSKKLAAPTLAPVYDAAEQATIDAALAIVTRRLFGRGAADSLHSPALTATFLRLQFAAHESECFGVIMLDSQHRAIAFEKLFFGTIDGTSVHPREVVRAAMRHNAAAVILAHNHPSGIAEPSQADELITRRLRDALALVEIRVLDHLIVGDGHVESFAERGLL